jgi:hypothetical protein
MVKVRRTAKRVIAKTDLRTVEFILGIIKLIAVPRFVVL